MFALLTFNAMAVGLDDVPQPTATDAIVDMAEVLSEDEERGLQLTLSDAARTGIVFDVVTVPSIDGADPKQFAVDLINRWHIGLAEDKPGAIVLLVVDARRVEVRLTTGLVRWLPESTIVRIEKQQMVPQFKEGDFGVGLTRGVRGLVGAAVAARLDDIRYPGDEPAQPALPEPDTGMLSAAMFPFTLAFVAMIGVFVALIRVAADRLAMPNNGQRANPDASSSATSDSLWQALISQPTPPAPDTGSSVSSDTTSYYDMSSSSMPDTSSSMDFGGGSGSSSGDGGGASW